MTQHLFLHLYNHQLYNKNRRKKDYHASITDTLKNIQNLDEKLNTIVNLMTLYFHCKYKLMNRN